MVAACATLPSLNQLEMAVGTPTKVLTLLPGLDVSKDITVGTKNVGLGEGWLQGQTLV